MVKRILGISLVSAAIVALWGLPSHFGYDPTCYICRRTLDVSCWTADFQTKLRIFSTLGQPAWLGAYLAILTSLVLALFLNSKRKLYAICYLLFAVLFYVDILFTKSRAALIGVWISLGFFVFTYFWLEIKKKVKKLSFKKTTAYTKPLLLISKGLITAVVIIKKRIKIISRGLVYSVVFFKNFLLRRQPHIPNPCL